jgi:Tfp pilus assembly protein PilN
MINVNLLPPMYIAARLARRRVRWWGLVSLGIGFVTALALTTARAALSEGPSDTGEEIARIEERLEADRRRVSEVGAKVRARLTELAASRAVGTHPDFSVLLEVLAALRGDQAMFESVSVATTEVVIEQGSKGKPPVTRPEMALELTGLARSPSTVASFVLRLEGTGIFSKVTLKNTQPRPVAPNRAVEGTGFAIRAVFAAGPAAAAKEERP